jgi:chromosomal replication initiator protein
VREESVPVPILIQNFDLERRIAILRKRAEEHKVILPTEVARYIAQNVRSNASALEGALIRLVAHSSLAGTQITLKYTQRVLANLIAAGARKAAVNPLQKLLSPLFGTKEAKIELRDSTAEDRHFVFCLMETRGVRKLATSNSNCK